MRRVITLAAVLTGAVLTGAAVLTVVALAAAASAQRSGSGLRVECSRPATLRLVRFEDRSARLYCAGRVLVRVGVPY